jgi:hypothetical protein
MTEEQEKVIAIFEARVSQIMQLCDTLRDENAALRQQVKALESAHEQLENDKRAIHTKYDNLKMARIIEVKQDDFKIAKQRLSQLVKEVDQCIALLNE